MVNKVILSLIRVYKKFGSPTLHYYLVVLFKSGCRFYPSCSEYAAEVFSKYSFGKALYKSLLRVSRCNPLTQSRVDLP